MWTIKNKSILYYSPADHSTQC